MRNVSANLTFARRRIVTFADAGQEQQARVVECPRRKHHQIRRLKHFCAIGVDVGYTGRHTVFVQHAADIGSGLH